MNAKMYASLEDTMRKWIDKWVETKEWEQLNFFCPSEIEIFMAKAASVAFDTSVQASVETEQNK